MSECQCELSGFCGVRNVAVKPTLQSICRTDKGRVDAFLASDGKPPEPKQKTAPGRRSCNTPNRGKCSECSNLGTLLTVAIETETGERISCGTCRNYLSGLNRTSTHDHAAIVQKLYSEISWPQHWRAKHGDKDSQKARIAELVATALQNATATCETPRRPGARKLPNHVQSRKSYTGWRSESNGPRIEYGPFVSSVRHLTYHVYAAKKHDSWKWNLEQIAKRWPLFNGTRILGIAEGKESQSATDVIAFAKSLGMRFDHHVIRPNNEKLREVVTWVPMLSLLKPESSSANEVVFSAHAKGQKYDDPAHTRDWTDLMYQTCLDDWPSVYNALRTSLMAGSMREYGLLGKWHNWAYSGTFFWWRLAEIGKRKWRDVDQWFAGTESWPGKMCDPRETACLFLNDSRRMYDAHYWTETVWPEWAKYLEARNAR